MSTLREIIRKVIIEDQTLLDLGVTPDGVYMGDVDTPLERPLIILRWGSQVDTQDTTSLQLRNLSVHIQDDLKDYARIDSIISRIRTLFDEFPRQIYDGGLIYGIIWTTDSEDLINSLGGSRSALFAFPLAILRHTNYLIMTSGS